MWIPSKNETIEMYARHFEALHRSGSLPLARETAHSLKKRGDHDGQEIWHRVAEKIEELRDDQRLATRRALEDA